jgi:uncharacterized protein (TIGR02757 family)
MELKQRLEFHYTAYDRSKISPDPLQFLHLYRHPNDIEIVGLLASVFAYGNVRMIVETMEKILKIVGEDPHRFVMELDFKKEGRELEKIRHRFYTGADTVTLFTLLNFIYKEYGSLYNLFLAGYSENDLNIKNALSCFSTNLLSRIKDVRLTEGVKFMFPDPRSGSACKRMNLFLRWMVRKDELDFGIWKEISTSKLIIPVDTHIARIAQQLGLTEKRTVSWGMAEEITNNLKKFDSEDPVKYDFALCHIGIRKEEF